LQKLEEAAKIDPDNVGALMLTGIMYEQNKDYPGARKAYESVLRINPAFAPAANNLAYIYSEYLNEPDKALRLARSARENAPEDANVADTLGWVLYKMGNYQWALDLLRESAAKMPNNAEVQFHLGMTHYQLGNSNEAKSALNRALELDAKLRRAEEAKKALAELP
ncbi:MAG: tetratricopeptide repeat protein, partial [Syntrophobacteraceae bacterium]